MNPFKNLIDFVRHFSNFSETDELLVLKYFEIEKFHKNDMILNVGEICHKLYFVEKGILRTFHTNKNGSDFTRLICQENDFCTILLSFTENVPSAANIQTLKDCTLFSINYQNFQEFVKSSENAKNIYTKILADFQNYQIQRIEFLTSYTPQEKVNIFISENKHLLQRLTDKTIASYLQIAPETYSRCKKNYKP